MGLGDLKNLQGDTAEALRRHDEAGAILRQLVRDNPSVTRFQQDHVGMMQVAAGEAEEAQKMFQEALASYERLLAADDGNRALEDSIARAHTNLGMVAYEASELDEAFDHYAQARQTYARLAGQMPEDAHLQDRLAASFSSLAAVEQARSNTDEALELYAKAQEIHERWLEGPAATLEHRQHLADTLYMVGAIRTASEQWLDASQALGRAAELAGGLLINHANNLAFRGLRAASLHDQGYALWMAEQTNEACEAYRQAVQEQRVAFELKPYDNVLRETLSRYLADLAAVERDTGRFDAALAACLERQKLWPKDADELYNVAREVAVLAATVTTDAAQREKLADQAISILAEAVAAGFKDWSQAEADEDLNILRDRPAYKELAKE
jgi:tetratricopeptide (TPR) repeat protein